MGAGTSGCTRIHEIFQNRINVYLFNKHAMLIRNDPKYIDPIKHKR